MKPGGYMNTAEGFSFTQQLFLGAFLASVGDISHIVYSNEILSEKKDKLGFYFQIQLLNLVWMFMCFFMLVIMLNFIIAVITSTYVRVIDF